MPAPEAVIALIERFERNREAYLSGQYNETQLRREFLDPLFTALGWDVDNKQGYAEAYKDVIHEDALKIGSAVKAPDYCFRIGGTRKFFVEAKKPSVNLKEDISPAFQLRRYAWSAKLPLSILTDFEEFAVYDCRVKPVKTDKASTARVLYMTYKEYAQRWDEISSVFTRDAVLKGSFDKYAEKGRHKKGTAEVDAAFLSEIESWRDTLARNIALRNEGLTQRELNFSVQRTIDRIIFLRICEDRGIEEYGRLMALLNGANVYKRLFQIFRNADERYNSGLFHFEKEKGRHEFPDDLTPSLDIDDKILKEMIGRLYYPESPYEFSVLPADILGQVYEQFLGKVIRLTEGHRAVVEEKPEVRKAGGVYYTPTYIVDYIVKNTVGVLVGKDSANSSSLSLSKADNPPSSPLNLRGDKMGITPKEVSKIRILDPACGSGSFLLGAYQYLLDYHRDWYASNDPQKWASSKHPALYQAQGNDWRLTTAERKRILLNNIYGVDIDSQAVEVTKLSLLLKVLEGENNQTLERQMKFFHERALPDLGDNIKCGNSLIGPDFYETGLFVGAALGGRPKEGQPQRVAPTFDEEERYRINVFDWNAEFPVIMKAGGFDAVIGNPPYIFTREQLADEERQYFATRYQFSWEKHNTFMLFMEKMLRLLKKGGRGGYIVPNSWLTIESAKLLRAAFVSKLELVADLNYLVFHHVSMEPCIFTVAGHDLQNDVFALRVNSEDSLMEAKPILFNRKKWIAPNYRIVFSDNTDVSTIIDKVLLRSKTIGDLFDVRTGLQAYEEGKGTPRQSADDVKNHVFDRENCSDEHSVKYLQGRDVGRYWLKWSGMWLQYGPWLSQPREIGIFTKPRVLIREITSDYPYCLNAMFVKDAYLNNKSVLNVLHHAEDVSALKTLAGILNSRLMSLFYKHKAVKSVRKVFPKVVIKNLREFPYPAMANKDMSKRLVHLVEQAESLNKQLASAKTDHDKTSLQRQIDATDKQIDKLVYELYGLTEEEIKIVEGGK